MTDVEWRCVIIRYMAHLIDYEGSTYTEYLSSFMVGTDLTALQPLADAARCMYEGR